MPSGKRKPVEQPQEMPPSAEAVAPGQDSAASPPSADQADLRDAQPQRQWVNSTPDPFGRDSIDLGDGRRLQLNRSGRWQQMQIKIVATQDGVDPKPKKEDGDTQWLRERGWNWKGDSETKAWTVQLLTPEEKDLPAPEKARRRAAVDKQAGQDFIELAQRIRERNGLPPVTVFAAEGRGA